MSFHESGVFGILLPTSYFLFSLFYFHLSLYRACLIQLRCLSLGVFDFGFFCYLLFGTWNLEFILQDLFAFLDLLYLHLSYSIIDLMREFIMPIRFPLPPAFSTFEVERLAFDLYGINMTAEPMHSYMDQNFVLSDEDGRKFVFKIANATGSWDTLDAQNRMTEYLFKKGWSYQCPMALRTQTGLEIAQVIGADRKSYFVRLLPFIPGDFLVDVKPHSDGLLFELGRFVGAMDRALAGFNHLGAHRFLPWDLNQAPAIGDQIANIEDAQRRRLVDYFLLQYETHVLPVQPGLRKSVIHNDANDYNILVKPITDGQHQLAGIIDFGDMVYSNTINELAITAAYAMLDKDDPIEAAAHVVRGYHQELPVTEREIDILFYLIAIRLCISVVMSAGSKKQNPDNTYLDATEPLAWQLLDELIAINPLKVTNRFRQQSGFLERIHGLPATEILEKRRTFIGPSLSISYKKPLKIVQGAMQYLFDEEDQTYLDAVNNVCHVGHNHPRVVRAAQRQMAILNTNTRYLHDYLVEYAERLTATMPEPLRVCYFVCSGSEANDLALRMARAKTGQMDNIVVEGAYHGTTIANIEISPYKFDGPGGAGAPTHVHKVPMPDTYRGLYRRDDPQAGARYAGHVGKAIQSIQKKGRELSAFICESIPGCGGQVVLPDKFLQEAYALVRQAGGVCIADEVQVGFGRAGSRMWAFQTQGVVPDIVTLGKPIGNGHPLAAVVTTPEIAAAFTTGMEYFNTFGGNPVSCAIGLAVLDVVQEEGLQEQARLVGDELMDGLRQLMDSHALIGDVRGLGLFVGVELVRDRKTLHPAGEEAARVIEAMKERGILISTDGPLHNVLKIKPPLVFNQANARFFVEILDEVLNAL